MIELCHSHPQLYLNFWEQHLARLHDFQIHYIITIIFGCGFGVCLIKYTLHPNSNFDTYSQNIVS